MTFPRLIRAGLTGCLLLGLAACGGATGTSSGDAPRDTEMPKGGPSGKLGDIFKNDTHVSPFRVNKYIWQAALDVLSFLPVESVDPFTGVIVTGYGTPHGGGRAYKAMIYVSDPALDARSLNVALQTRSGPVAASTVRAVEDAIPDPRANCGSTPRKSDLFCLHPSPVAQAVRRGLAYGAPGAILGAKSPCAARRAG